MQVAIFRNDEPHPETRAELQRENDALKAYNRVPARYVPDPSFIRDTPQYSFEPFRDGEPPHMVVECPAYHELAPSRSGLALYPNTPNYRPMIGLGAHAVVEAVRKMEHGLTVAVPPLVLALFVTRVEVGDGGATGRLFSIDPPPAVGPCEGLALVPDGTFSVVGPAGSKVIEREGRRLIAVRSFSGFKHLTAEEAAERAVRRVDGWTEQAPAVFN